MKKVILLFLVTLALTVPLEADSAFVYEDTVSVEISRDAYQANQLKMDSLLARGSGRISKVSEDKLYIAFSQYNQEAQQISSISEDFSQEQQMQELEVSFQLMIILIITVIVVAIGLGSVSLWLIK